MAKFNDTATFKRKGKKTTSIGKSKRTRIKNKQKRRHNGGSKRK